MGAPDCPASAVGRNGVCRSPPRRSEFIRQASPRKPPCYNASMSQRAVVGLKLFPRLLLALFLVGSVTACSALSKINPFSSSSASSDEDTPEADASTVPVEELYNRGVDAMNDKRYVAAAKQFDLVEENYPYSSWSVNAQLMQGYSQYLQQHYTDAIGTLDRFIQLHPAHRDIAYAYYLRSLSFYEQISDIKRDQKATQDAIGALQEVVNRFPDSAYGRDALL